MAGVLHLLKTEDKNSFAISAQCPKGLGLPQSHRSVLLSPMCVLLSRWCDSGTHTAILIVSAWSRHADSNALTLPACSVMFTGTDQSCKLNQAGLLLFFSASAAPRSAVTVRDLGVALSSLFSYVLGTFEVYSNLGCGPHTQGLPLWWVGCL